VGKEKLSKSFNKYARYFRKFTKKNVDF